MGRFHLNQINCNNLFYSQSRDFPSSIRGYVVGFKRVDQRQPSIFRRSLCGDFSSLLSVLTFVFCKLNSFQITEMAIKISARQSVFDITGFQFLFCLQQKNTTFVSKKKDALTGLGVVCKQNTHKYHAQDQKRSCCKV